MDEERVGDVAAGYFAQLRERFERAASAADGVAEDEIEIGGLRLRLRWAGEAMRRVLLLPFEHLARPPAPDPDLEIALFDTASTGVEAPPPVWPPAPAAPGTNPVVRLQTDRIGILAAAGSRALTVVEPGAGRAVFHLPDAAAIPASERAAPMREALQLLMAPRGRVMTHAGAVGRGGRGVLLVGRGGSGKSTLALGCAMAGLEIVADDYVLLEPESLFAHAMQSTAKLTEDGVERLGVPPAAIDPVGFEPTLEGPAKALTDVRVLSPGALRPRLRIAALVAPHIPVTSPFVPLSGTKGEVSRGEPVPRRVSGAEGLRAVAPSTIAQSGFSGGQALAALAGVVRRVPSYALELSSDPAANAHAVDRLVAELG
ncbi:MAG TPA: hypothetical protein VF245_05610 [Solirubrobacterales bacterium]